MNYEARPSLQLAARDRRDAPRHRVALEARLSTPEGWQRVACMDLSLTGMGVVLLRTVAPGARLWASLDLPHGTVQARARVVRLEDAAAGIVGLAFEDPSAVMLAAISEWVRGNHELPLSALA